MIELVNTSVPNGLIAGTHGFATVAMTRGTPDGLRGRLEALCAYSHRTSAHDESYWRENPVNWFHAILPGGESVTGRVAPCDFDYTGRTNRIARLRCHKRGELTKRGAAFALMRGRDWYAEGWSGEPRHLEDNSAEAARLKLFDNDDGVAGAPAWRRTFGERGEEYARGLARQLERNILGGGKTIWFKTSAGWDRSGERLLELFSEVIGMMPAEMRGRATFATYPAATAGGAGWGMRGVHDTDKAFEAAKATSAWVDCERGRVENAELLPAGYEADRTGALGRNQMQHGGTGATIAEGRTGAAGRALGSMAHGAGTARRVANGARLLAPRKQRDWFFIGVVSAAVVGLVLLAGLVAWYAISGSGGNAGADKKEGTSEGTSEAKNAKKAKTEYDYETDRRDISNSCAQVKSAWGKIEKESKGDYKQEGNAGTLQAMLNKVEPNANQMREHISRATNAFDRLEKAATQTNDYCNICEITNCMAEVRGWVNDAKKMMKEAEDTESGIKGRMEALKKEKGNAAKKKEKESREAELKAQKAKAEADKGKKKAGKPKAYEGDLFEKVKEVRAGKPEKPSGGKGEEFRVYGYSKGEKKWIWRKAKWEAKRNPMDRGREGGGTTDYRLKVDVKGDGKKWDAEDAKALDVVFEGPVAVWVKGGVAHYDWRGEALAIFKGGADADLRKACFGEKKEVHETWEKLRGGKVRYKVSGVAAGTEGREDSKPICWEKENLPLKEYLDLVLKGRRMELAKRYEAGTNELAKAAAEKDRVEKEIKAKEDEHKKCKDDLSKKTAKNKGDQSFKDNNMKLEEKNNEAKALKEKIQKAEKGLERLREVSKTKGMTVEGLKARNKSVKEELDKIDKDRGAQEQKMREQKFKVEATAENGGEGK